MVKLIRDNQKMVLAGLMILSMLTFVVTGRTGNSDRGGTDREYATFYGKPIFVSELNQARAELTALKTNVDFSNQPMDDQGQLRDPKTELMRDLILVMSRKPDWYLMLRHEANADGMQVSSDDVLTIMTNDTQLKPDAEDYGITQAGVEGLLKIIERYQTVSSALKISKPMSDREVIARAESMQLEVIQLKSSDFLTQVPLPTTQQCQDQFTRFAADVPHHPTPTTNPFGFGYRLPQRMKMQYFQLTTEAANTTVIASKSAYDWEVASRKYYLSHPDEFAFKPTTNPAIGPTTLPATMPTGPQPFALVQGSILASLRQPLVEALMSQVQGYINATLSSDWQAYSKFISAKTGMEPVSSVGVPYSSPTYMPSLSEKVLTKFAILVVPKETPIALSQDQIASMPDVGTAKVGTDAAALASAYLDAVQKNDPAAQALLLKPFLPIPDPDVTSPVFFRLNQVLPSGPAPDLASVADQVSTDVRSAAAYKLAVARAADLVAQCKDRPMLIVAPANSPPVSITKLTLVTADIPEIKPTLGDEARAFTRQAFDLLTSYDPVQNRNPAKVIEVPTQGRAFASQLVSVDAKWDADMYFKLALFTRSDDLKQMRKILFNPWLEFEAARKRTEFKVGKG